MYGNKSLHVNVNRKHMQIKMAVGSNLGWTFGFKGSVRHGIPQFNVK